MMVLKRIHLGTERRKYCKLYIYNIYVKLKLTSFLPFFHIWTPSGKRGYCYFLITYLCLCHTCATERVRIADWAQGVPQGSELGPRGNSVADGLKNTRATPYTDVVCNIHPP